MHQLIVAIQDIHDQGVIHRDLKLGNLLLTDKLQIRVGDFGLAAKVMSRTQKRKTMCGTPNYIAPEILDNVDGHSF
jgi:polo-like kinase 1